jgi:hypothetical protein
VTGLFALANVGVLYAVGYYLYQTKLRVALIAALTRLHQRQARLQDELTRTRSAIADLEAAMIAQKQFCKLAAQRLAQWRAYQLQVAEHEKEAAVSRTKLLVHKQEQQIHALQIDQVRAGIVEQVVAQAQQELRKKFSQPAVVAKYAQQITDQLGYQ